MSPDVLRTLAQARPADLDPDAPVDPATRETELGRAMSGRSSGAAGTARTPRTRSRIRPVWGGAGLVGAAAAAALVVTTVTGGQGGGVPSTPAAPADGRTLLLAAAEEAETAPATGKYWRVKEMHLVPVRVGPESRRYTVEDARISETWVARNGQRWTGRRAAGAEPKTPADEKAWRLDGSPAEWDLGVGDTIDKKRISVRAEPGEGELIKVAGSPGLEVAIAGPQPSLADLRDLPADPTELRALAEKRALSDGGPGRLKAENPKMEQGFAAYRLVPLLTKAPVPPRVRAAAFRALAGMPIVRSEGKAKDARGRDGVAFSIVVPNKSGSVTTRLIIDPDTSQVLSERVVSKRDEGKGKNEFVEGKDKKLTTLYLGAGWTDRSPHVPTLP